MIHLLIVKKHFLKSPFHNLFNYQHIFIKTVFIKNLIEEIYIILFGAQTVLKQLFPPPRSTYLNCFSLHMNWISPSSSGSHHFNSTVEASTTSGFKNKPRASLKSQSSGEGCFCRNGTHDPTPPAVIMTFLIIQSTGVINSRWGQYFLGSLQSSRVV